MYLLDSKSFCAAAATAAAEEIQEFKNRQVSSGINTFPCILQESSTLLLQRLEGFLNTIQRNTDKFSVAVLQDKLSI